MERCKTNINWYARDKFNDTNEITGYALNTQNGFFVSGPTIRNYCHSKFYGKQGDIIQLKFNWKQPSLHYIVNGKDLGNALMDNEGTLNKVSESQTAEYRFAICILPTKDKGWRSYNSVQLNIEGQEFS